MTGAALDFVFISERKSSIIVILYHQMEFFWAFSISAKQVTLVLTDPIYLSSM